MLLQSPYGVIECSWQVHSAPKNIFSITVRVPANCQATIHLPQTQAREQGGNVFVYEVDDDEEDGVARGYSNNANKSQARVGTTSEKLCLSKCIDLREGDVVRNVQVGSGVWRVESLWFDDSIKPPGSEEEERFGREAEDEHGWIVC